MWLVSREPSWDLVSWLLGQVSLPLLSTAQKLFIKGKAKPEWVLDGSRDRFLFVSEKISGALFILCGGGKHE